MPTKTTGSGREYDVTGKMLTWYPLGEDDKPGTLPNLPDVKIPLRLKLGQIRDMAAQELDPAAMFAILERLISSQAESLDEMDINDFTEMFSTWQNEYNALSGASLGE